MPPSRLLSPFVTPVSYECGDRTVEFTPDQFWSRVHRTDGCWPWVGTFGAGGYGQLTVRVAGAGGGVNPCCIQAKRMAWTLLVGPIPDGYEIDHLCRNRACVNPAHLEPVLPAVNKRRAAVRSQDERRREHDVCRSEWVSEVLEAIDTLRVTQRDFAELLGVTEATVSRWVNGHRSPSRLTRRRLRDLLTQSAQESAA